MIQAFGERVLVRIVELEKKKGILIVPEEKKEFQIGCIASIGAGLVFEGIPHDSPIFVGDYVYTRKYAGLLIEYDGVEYVSLDTKEILAFAKEMR